MMPAILSEWFDLEVAAGVLNVSRRHAARELAKTLDNQRFLLPNPSGRGRPRVLIHYSAHPALRASYVARTGYAPDCTGTLTESAVAHAEEKRVIAADDVACAQMRARAVTEYRHLCSHLDKRAAAQEIASAWSRRPRSQTVTLRERLPDGHEREQSAPVSVGGFSPKTLRRWDAIYKEGDILSLAPDRKGKVGRRWEGKTIAPDLLNYVAGLAISTARADVASAVRKARNGWTGFFPDVSMSTWCRQIRKLDPEKVGATLGKLGIAAFRRDHSPDIERDYSRNEDGTPFRYNQLWQLDDAYLDFYGHGFDPNCLVRPYTYKIIRVSTRQWICSVACQTPITQEQVRSLIGLALAQPSGGLPEEITFERGTVACDASLEGLLTDLGVKVHRTSMDGGHVHPGAVADRATGHWQGKLIEANIRRMHHCMNDAPMQTGPEERHTAHANLEHAKKEAVRRLAAGEKLLTMQPDEWAGYIHRKDEEMNNTPHSGLPEILVNPETMERRHMTPNEYAQHLCAREDAATRKLDDRLVPLFFEKGYQVTVEKNGIRINRQTYGRMDEGLQALCGSPVKVYSLSEYPNVVYVVELGRLVERYERPGYGATGQIEQKRAIERIKRNGYEALVAAAQATGRDLTLETVAMTADPVPGRRILAVAPPQLLQRAAALAAHKDDQREKAEELESRFSLVGAGVSASPGGTASPASGSLDDATADFRAQLEAMGGGFDSLNPDS